MAAINMTDEDKQRWYNPLLEYFLSKDMTEFDAVKKIEETFAVCQLGWNRAPRDIDTRIKVKTGFQWKSHQNLKPNRKNFEPIKPDPKEKPTFEDYDIQKSMTQSEKNWWKERMGIYMKDFEFNISSDAPLLNQLLVEELIQRRLFSAQLKNPKTDYSKQLNDSLKRISEVQQRLGITRQQREGQLNNIDGNVAELALKLEEKLKQMPEKLKAEYEEELYYDNLKKQKPPINILPPIEKIEALLNVDGKISASLDGDKISEISEAVAKEVMKEKPPKKELPDGIDINVSS